MKLRYLTLMSFYLLSISPVLSESRIMISDIKINGTNVRFALDTGSDLGILFGSTARRLNIDWKKPDPSTKAENGEVPLGWSEEVVFDTGNNASRRRFRILEVPSYIQLDVDGVLPWTVLNGKIIQIYPASREVLELNELPSNISEWNSWKLLANKSNPAPFGFEITDEDGTSIIFIDTGLGDGAALPPKQWSIWRNNNSTNNATLKAAYMPSTGMRIYEESWAEKLTIGNFAVDNIPVTQSYDETYFRFENCKAILGVFAFTRLEVIFDFKNNVMYTRDVSTPAEDYKHNRLSAVFVPDNPAIDDYLKAHVVDDGVAFNAGIRNGDVLIKINELDVTKWRTTPEIMPIQRFWEQADGTELRLELLRDGKPYTTTVVLRNVFPSISEDKESTDK